jgi:hypothetical protein
MVQERLVLAERDQLCNIFLADQRKAQSVQGPVHPDSAPSSSPSTAKGKGCHRQWQLPSQLLTKQQLVPPQQESKSETSLRGFE